MWKLVFDSVTNRGVGFNREAGEGEFAVSLPPSECAWFNATPERYQYVGGVFSEVDSAILAAEKLLKAKEDIWIAIRDERDRRVQTNGFKVEVSSGVFKWFHSDVFSRTQQLGLVMAGAAVPSVAWKTMDGSFVTMSQAIAAAIYASAAATDPAIFTAAEQHKAAAWALEDPTTYTAYLNDDNWPERYK